MKENISNLSILLDNIKKEIDKRLYIETISIPEVDITMLKWQEQGAF